MKKLLLASAIAALTVSTAQAAPTVYGKAFLTADYVNAEIDFDNGDVQDVDEDTVEINSTGSKIGLRGSEAMTANTDVVYQLEYGIRVDGEDRTLQSRDTYLGLANRDYGEFRVGRNYSVVDYINNIYRTEGYFDNIGVSTLDSEGTDVDSLIEALTLTDGDRINNSIVWIAPKYNDLPLELALMYGADESFSSSDNGYGASLMFDQGTGFTVGIAYEKDLSLSTTVDYDAVFDPNDDQNILVDAFSETTSGDIIRGTASLDLSRFTTYPVTLGVLYQQADYDFRGAEEEDGLILSAEMALDGYGYPAVAYIQYDKTDNLGGVDGNDSDQIVIGGKYSYRDNMIVHAYAGINSADIDGGYLLSDTNNGITTIERESGDTDIIAVGAGLEYLF